MKTKTCMNNSEKNSLVDTVTAIEVILLQMPRVLLAGRPEESGAKRFSLPATSSLIALFHDGAW